MGGTSHVLDVCTRTLVHARSRSEMQRQCRGSCDRGICEVHSNLCFAGKQANGVHLTIEQLCHYRLPSQEDEARRRVTSRVSVQFCIETERAR